MTAIIETERLVLRDWTDADRGPFAAMNADAEVMRYFPNVQTRAESDGLVDRVAAHFPKFGFGLWALEERESGAFIGFTGFQTCDFPCPVEGDVEIGWRLARSHWRRGLAFEAAFACLDWYWRETDCQRVVSFTARQNEPSWQLMTKLGLEHRPDLDFDHPKLEEGSPLCPHVVYVKDRPQ